MIIEDIDQYKVDSKNNLVNKNNSEDFADMESYMLYLNSQSKNN